MHFNLIGEAKFVLDMCVCVCFRSNVVALTCHLRLIHWKLTLDNLYFCHCYIFYTQKVLPFCTKFDSKNFGGYQLVKKYYCTLH